MHHNSVRNLVQLFAAVLGFVLISSSDAAPGAYRDPTNRSLSGNGNWLAAGASEYISGLYHLGTDIGARNGTPVYAVSCGEVVYVANGGDVVNNMLVWIRHPLNGGGSFYAIYAHIHPTVSVGSRVESGDIIGSIADYPPAGPTQDHLHFGTRSGSILTNGWGRGQLPVDWAQNPDKSRLDRKGFEPAYDYLEALSKRR